MENTVKNDKILISTHKEGNLYFSVAISSSSNKIVRIALPNYMKDITIAEISKDYPEFKLTNKHEKTAEIVSRVYNGEKLHLNPELLDLEINESSPKKSPVKTLFERKVLLQTAEIPFGEVVTYKCLAEKLETHAYRAVGTALGKNPFPIIIPCHRVVKSDMVVGEYRGGNEMKKELLKNEGVQIKGDKIIPG